MLLLTDEKIKDQAKSIAHANKRAEPGIKEIYWFPDNNEIRLLELESDAPSSLSGKVEPFYFNASPEDGVTMPLAISIINAKEFKKLKLPRAWGEWRHAVPLDV